MNFIRSFLNTSKRSHKYLLFLQKPISRFFSDQPSDFEVQRETPKCLITETIPLALYGGRHTVTMLPGTGIGPEVSKHVRHVFREMGAPVDFEVIHIDPNASSEDDLQYALMSVKRNGVGIKGDIGGKSLSTLTTHSNVILRNELDLYVYVIWCRSYPNVPAKHKDVDIVVVRQNTEGEYSMLEHSVGGSKVVETLKIVRRDSSVKLATYAFEYAKKHNRKKVTTIHKANIMKLSDGLFLSVSKQIAKQYPEIEHNDLIIDNFCMQVVTNPKQFDVLLTTNLYGSIAANVICGITGGPGLTSGINYGLYYAIFEPGTRASGVTIAGKNMANPVAMLNASVDMLYHLGHTAYAKRLEYAIYKTICEDKIHTPDLKGSATTVDVVNKILEYIYLESIIKVVFLLIKIFMIHILKSFFFSHWDTKIFRMCE
ncbi:isocitrate dehydrogenase [NAD] subunit gamma, mitochondrial-like [Zophobas morio]|uniref:isocitrate dehydrogenase [NAD] subunit gamma, mitochondrial-like n=1 Tax=Zophobas morio TaxID=2755281 RepID=UPI003082BC4B